jgi:hypothetical protein
MSSRQEEKERRKRERQDREAAEKASAARRKRMQLVFGAGLAVVAVIAIFVVGAFVLGGGDDGEAEVPASSAAIPAQQESDLKKAAAAAGCTLVDAPNEGSGHEEREFKPSDYKQNPPTSGNHFPQWYQDGTYEPGDTPELGKLVHTLEHGRIDVQYKPGTPATTVAQLETFMKENEDGYHMLLFQNGTKMPFAVAATAWDHQLGCKTMNAKVFDALRTFRQAYIDKGPEVVP